nr:MAG TPA_asm: hypothetical protein [Caudoviricetes sp.]
MIRVSLASSDLLFNYVYYVSLRFFILFFLLCKCEIKFLLYKCKDVKQQRITPLDKLSHWSTPVPLCGMYNYLNKRKDESNK